MNVIKLIKFFVFTSFFIFSNCASLLPPEKRIYPRNPIPLPNGMNIYDWLELKKNQFPNRMQRFHSSEGIYKITFYRKNKTKHGSYISCSALVRQSSPNTLDLSDMIYTINYHDYFRPMTMRKHGGEIGPVSEIDRTEILFPCIEEFLESDEEKSLEN
ncbi:MAG: hypothetical protein SH817_03885 [Leptospira sp.]|nr:hypothetical protein [Leptospira sp.]